MDLLFDNFETMYLRLHHFYVKRGTTNAMLMNSDEIKIHYTLIILDKAFFEMVFSFLYIRGHSSPYNLNNELGRGAR